MNVLISCESGGDAIPDRWVAHGRSEIGSRSTLTPSVHVPLSTLPRPLAVDAAARHAASEMASRLKAKLITNRYSADLIDVTRSLHRRGLFSNTTRQWSTAQRQLLIDQIYNPYRTRVRSNLSKMLARNPFVVHLSVRSFPLRDGDRVQRADMGLLYDPARDDEVDLCLDWIDEMYDRVPMLRVRRNYPLRGTRDSIVRAMRSEFAGQNYLGVEVMLNQAWAGRPLAVRDEVLAGICESLRLVIDEPQSEAA